MAQTAIQSLFQHAAITAGVTVRVAVSFMPEQSRVGAGRWFWVYHIRLENGRDETVQLKSRHWRITDCARDGEHRRWRRRGGRNPGAASRGRPMITYRAARTDDEPWARWKAIYTFIHADGTQFEVAIPYFPLAAPAEARYNRSSITADCSAPDSVGLPPRALS